MSTNDLVIFDLDGTLITPYMENPNREYHTWSLLPGRQEKLHDLHAAGTRIAIATNQAGVAFGHIEPHDVHTKLASVIRALGFTVQQCTFYDRAIQSAQPSSVAQRTINIFVCYSHQRATVGGYTEGHERRKPAPAMLEEAMRVASAAPASTVFVGDDDTDAQAARAAGVRFIWQDHYFAAAEARSRASTSTLRSLDDLYMDLPEH